MGDLDIPYLTVVDDARRRRVQEFVESHSGPVWSWDKTVPQEQKQTQAQPPGYGTTIFNAIGRGIIGGLYEPVPAFGQFLSSAYSQIPVLGQYGGPQWQNVFQQASDYLAKWKQKYPVSDPRRVSWSPDTWVPMSSPKWWVERFSEAVPGMAAFITPSLAATKMVNIAGSSLKLTPELIDKLAFIGSKIASPAAFGAMDAGSTYLEAKRAGWDDSSALRAASTMGLASTALGAINFHAIMKEGASALGRAVQGGASTAAITFLQSGARASILGEDVISALRDSLDAMIGPSLAGGASAAALGARPSRPQPETVKPGGAAKGGPIPQTPEQQAFTDRLRGELASRMQQKVAQETAAEVPGTSTAVPGGEAPWIADAKQRYQERLAKQQATQEGKADPRFGFLYAFLTDGKRVPKTQAEEYLQRTVDILQANPEANEVQLIAAASKDLVARKTKFIPAPEQPTEPSKTTPASPIGQDSLIQEGKVVVGENDRYVLDEMRQSVADAVVEPTSGKRVPVPGSENEPGGLRFMGTPTLKPDWMQIPGKPGEYYRSADVLKVIETLKQGEWPTSALQARIASDIEIALRTDAEREKARAFGTETPPSETQSAPSEETMRTAFFGEVERLSQAEQAQPESVLSDWQKSMVDLANAGLSAEGKTETAAPEAEHLPGFKYAPGGPEGTIGKLLEQIRQDVQSEAEREIQKRGVVSDEAVRSKAETLIREKKWDLERVASLEPGTILPAEEWWAARAVASAAMLNAGRIRKLALQGLYDEGAAASIYMQAALAARNVSAVSSETGRALRLAQQEGQVAGAGAIMDLMPLDPSGGGMVRDLYSLPPNERATFLADHLGKTAGGTRVLLEQIEALSSGQRKKLESAWLRYGRAGWDLFYGSLLSPISAAKNLVSVAPTAGHLIATTAAAEYGRKLLNVVAPWRVAEVKGVVDGSTMAAWHGLVQGLFDSYRMIAESGKATAKIAKAEGVTAAEKALGENLRQQMEELGAADLWWKREPAMTSEQLPELADIIGKWTDYIGMTTRMVSHSMSLGDVVGKVIFDRIGAYIKANEMAVSEGLSGEARASRAVSLVSDRPPEINAAGVELARKGTFSDPFEGRFMKEVENLSKFPAVRYAITPFFHGIMKIAQWGAEGTPLIQNFMTSWWRDVAAGGAKRDLAFAKMAVGWGLGAVVWQMAGAGMITGAAPKDPDAIKFWKAAGKLPYSVWDPAGGKWVSYEGLEPVSTILGIIATSYQAFQRLPDDSLIPAVLTVFATAGDALLSKRYTQGLSNFMAVLSSPNMEERIQAMVKQLVPPVPLQGTLGIVRREVDPIQRDVRGMVDRYLNFVPGFSEKVPALRNIITGDKILYEGALGPDFISPFMTMTPKRDAVLDEILRLNGAGIRWLPDHISGVNPPQFVQAQVEPMPPGVALTGEQRDRWHILMTQDLKPGGRSLHDAMQGLMGRPQYQSLDDTGKSLEMFGLFSQYKQAALAALLREDKTLAARVGGTQAERQIRRLPLASQPRIRERLSSRFVFPEPIIGR